MNIDLAREIDIKTNIAIFRKFKINHNFGVNSLNFEIFTNQYKNR